LKSLIFLSRDRSIAEIFRHFLRAALASFKTRHALGVENLALRQQLAVLERSITRPRLRPFDRLFWVILSRCCPGWRELLHIVTPKDRCALAPARFSLVLDQKKQTRSPWQNPFVERAIGSIRRDCLDHAIVLGELHLRRILRGYLGYYHRSRTHLSLNKDPPHPRLTEAPEMGAIVSFPCVGGLHHRYTRLAA